MDKAKPLAQPEQSDLQVTRAFIGALDAYAANDAAHRQFTQRYCPGLPGMAGVLDGIDPAAFLDQNRHFHQQGDALWDAVAERLPEMRKLAARYGVGGGVFGVLAPHKPADIAQARAAAVQIADAYVAAPAGLAVVALKWDTINEDQFERLIFNFVSNAPGYSNAQWLTNTNAPDRGRDISATKTFEDSLGGTWVLRVIIQCKHWRSKSIGLDEVSTLVRQMDLWEPPKVDELVIATTGRFTSDAVTWIEKHNYGGEKPRIAMWPDSHLEMLLATRRQLVADFHLGSTEGNRNI